MAVKQNKKNSSNNINKVVFIITDTLRTQNISIYNSQKTKTPTIDTLAKNGVYFTNAYASITCTDPSITSIMTGKYPLSIGLINHGKYISKEEEESLKKETFLSEHLRSNGYFTAAVDWLNRWHKRGYQYYSGKINKNDDDPVYPVFDKLPFPLLFRIIDKILVKFIAREVFIRSYFALNSNPHIPYDTADIIVDKGIDILKKNSKKKLFLYLHFWDAHAPHVRPRGFKSYLLHNVQDTYSAEVEYLDRELQRLTNYLKESNQLNNTLIVLTSDHGENLSEHDIPFNHDNLFDDVVKIPLIFYNPSFKKKKIEQLVQHVDIFPTVLEMLKTPFTGDIDGRSLVGLIKGTQKKHREFVYFEDITYRKLSIPAPSRRRGLLTENYRYIQTLTNLPVYNLIVREDAPINKEQLFDRKRDKKQKNNIASHNMTVVNNYRNLLQQFTESLHENRLKKDKNFFQKIEKTRSVIKKTMKIFSKKDIMIAWKGGKDTTVMMHILKRMNNGNIPFKVFFNDTTLEFKETYDFIFKLKKNWQLDLKILKHSENMLNRFNQTKNQEEKSKLAQDMKIDAIQRALKKFKNKAFMLGIRRDENPARKNEKFLSSRKDHIRVHPLLDWTEEDIWKYTKQFGVPYSSLYDKGYRSAGERMFTSKVLSHDTSERAGRDQHKEKIMVQLRKMGYW